MNTKLRKALSEKCKDMGLSQKAIDQLTEIGGEGLKEDASDEDINLKAENLAPFAAAMQSEVTRKVSSAKQQSAKQSPGRKGEGSEGEGEDAKPATEEIPAWAKKFEEKLTALEAENAKLKSEKAQTERQTLIAAKAKELGIPDYLMKRVAFADDADIEKELTDYKQDLVNNNLVPKGQAHETGSTAAQMKADAMAWAKTLPDR